MHALVLRFVSFGILFFLQYLDKIGEQFFGVVQAGKPGAGGLLSLLSGSGERNGGVGKRGTQVSFLSDLHTSSQCQK